MSLRWNESLQLELTLDAVRASLRRGWPRPAVVARGERETGARAQAAAEAGAAPSAAAVGALKEAIGDVLHAVNEDARLQGLSVDVSVGAPLVCFDVVEGDFRSSSDRELSAIASACMDELLGEAAPDHAVQWQVQADGRHVLIAALSRPLHRMLEDVAREFGLRIASIAPDFCVQWNRFAADMKHGQGIFAVLSGQDAQLAYVRGGAISTMSIGPWRDRMEQVPAPSSNIRQLISGLGLTAALPPNLLDLRTDRLLASLGCDVATKHDFVLVAPEARELLVSSRWIRHGSLQGAA